MCSTCTTGANISTPTSSRQFEKETGIDVVYNTFDSNENLYSRIQTTSYDVIIPSDYMVSRFIEEDMLQPINFDHIPNMALIDEQYTHLSFDPEQKYSVPYTWGVVGIVYNTKYVDESDIGSWDLLWNPKYKNQTAMFNNSRDALGLALMYLGYSLNTTDKAELREAADLIIQGKPVFQGIWMDQILEKLPAEEIVAAPYYNGDAVTMIDENEDLAFYVPKEGTNLFVDAMCIPKNAKMSRARRNSSISCVRPRLRWQTGNMSVIPARSARSTSSWTKKRAAIRSTSPTFPDTAPKHSNRSRRKSTNIITIFGWISSPDLLSLEKKEGEETSLPRSKDRGFFYLLLSFLSQFTNCS